MLAEEGFEASVVDIVERAQVGMASLYRRWESREVLIESLMEEMLTEAHEKLLAVDQNGLDPRETIRAINRVGYDQVKRYGVFASYVTNGHIPIEFQAKAMPRVRLLWRFMGATIKRGIELGLFRSDVDVRFGVRAWLALVSPIAVEGQRETGVSYEKVADRVTDFVVNSMRV